MQKKGQNFSSGCLAPNCTLPLLCAAFLQEPHPYLSLLFSCLLPIIYSGICHEIKRCLLLWSKVMTNLDSILKSRDITLPTKVCLVKTMVFPVVMDGCESWTIKKAEHWRTDAFEPWCWRRLLSPLDCQVIQPVHPKGDQSWVFTGRTNIEAESLILCAPDAKSLLIGKDPDAGKDWGQEYKGTTEVEMVGWHYPLDGHGFVWTPGAGDGQGGLACCSPWGHKELDTTELNSNEWARLLQWCGQSPRVRHSGVQSQVCLRKHCC